MMYIYVPWWLPVVARVVRVLVLFFVLFFVVHVFFDFSLTVKAAPHECVIRTGQP